MKNLYKLKFTVSLLSLYVYKKVNWIITQWNIRPHAACIEGDSILLYYYFRYFDACTYTCLIMVTDIEYNKYIGH
jgi:hypothetical protein